MSCYQETKYIDYLDGLLKPNAQASFKTHMETCAGCRKVLHQLELTLGCVKELPVELPGEDYWPLHYQGIQRRIQALKEEKAAPSYKPWHWQWWWAPRPALAAAFSLMAVSFIIIRLVVFPPSPDYKPDELTQIHQWGKNLTMEEFQEIWSSPPAEEEFQALPAESRRQVTNKLLQVAELPGEQPVQLSPAVTADDDDEFLLPSTLEDELERLTPEQKQWLEQRLKELA